MHRVFALLIMMPMAALGQWTTIVPAAQQSKTISAMIPEGVMYRFLSNSGKATTPVVSTGEHSISDWSDGTPGHPRDPDPKSPKAFQVANGTKQITVTVKDFSVKPIKVTTIVVPALPKKANKP